MQIGPSVCVLHDHHDLVCCPHPTGVYTLADLREFGRKRGWCPYFLARHLMAFANVVVYNYQYMIDPKVSQVRRCTAVVYFTAAQRAPMPGAVFVPARPFPGYDAPPARLPIIQHPTCAGICTWVSTLR